MIKKLVREGDLMPWTYGVGWHSHSHHGYVCYPVPLNLLLRWLRTMCFWLARPAGWQWLKIDAGECDLDGVWRQGRDEGRREAKREAQKICLATAQKLQLQPDDALLVKYPKDFHYVALNQIRDGFRDAGYRNVIVFLPPGYTLETVPEYTMQQAGWYRIPEPYKTVMCSETGD